MISTWFKNTYLYETSEDKVIIACADAYSKNVIEQRYAEKIKGIIKGLRGKQLDVGFLVKAGRIAETMRGPLFDDLPGHQAPTEQSHSSPPPQTQPRSSFQQLNPSFTLDTFVVGVSNRVVHAATTAVVESPGQLYNPLFIYGQTGVGKTHLLHAVGNALIRRHPNFRIIYTSTEQFVNDMVEHIRQKKDMQHFRLKYRSCNALLIDDIQFLSGKESSQEEFYHTFNEITQGGGQIIIASDREPSQIAGLTDRLVSRFRGGLMTMVSPPDYETRLAIITSKAREHNLTLSPSIIEYIAEQSIQNIREIQGIILQIKSLEVTRTDPINLAAVRSIIDPTYANRKITRRITPEVIIDAITSYFSLSIKDLCGKRRSRDVVIPRQLAMFLMRNELGMNLVEIGSILGGRDHTTIIHGCEQVKHQIEELENSVLRSHLNSLRQEIYA